MQHRRPIGKAGNSVLSLGLAHVNSALPPCPGSVVADGLPERVGTIDKDAPLPHVAEMISRD
jgi:hypothetical protein